MSNVANATTERVIGYVRVSSDDQMISGLGLEAQRDTIAAECDRRGWTLVEVCEDAGASAKTLDGRPALQQALAAVETGSADAIVVAKLDRLSCSILDFADLMERSRSRGWSIVILDLGVDTTTPSGELIANVMATFAQFERRIIGQRTKEALAAKKRQGHKLGRPEAIQQVTMRRIETMRLNGASLRSIADALNVDGVPTAQGGHKWHASTVQQALIRCSRELRQV